MKVDDFLREGNAEGFKLGWHVCLGLFCLGSAVYNLSAYSKRREPHLLRNGLIYSAGVGLEVLQVKRHLEKVEVDEDEVLGI